MRPLIGVPTSPFKNKFRAMPFDEMPVDELRYLWLLARLNALICDSVRDAGGVPIELYPTGEGQELDTIVRKMDGFVFTGGDDIHPDFYNEAVFGTVAPNPDRDRFEFGLLERIFSADKPALGICRGAQLINVAMGGTLIQHLPDVKPEWKLHKRPDIMNGYVHYVEIIKAEIFPGLHEHRMNVNSIHHQAIKDLAPDLEIAAVTEDGLIEAFFAPQRRHLVGVQWHPECISKTDPLQAGLFEALVRASIEN